MFNFSFIKSEQLDLLYSAHLKEMKPHMTEDLVLRPFHTERGALQGGGAQLGASQGGIVQRWQGAISSDARRESAYTMIKVLSLLRPV